MNEERRFSFSVFSTRRRHTNQMHRHEGESSGSLHRANRTAQAQRGVRDDDRQRDGAPCGTASRTFTQEDIDRSTTGHADLADGKKRTTEGGGHQRGNEIRTHLSQQRGDPFREPCPASGRGTESTQGTARSSRRMILEFNMRNRT
jgi:hypothetical protein